MDYPRDEHPWDELARFAERRFEGISGHATAVVDGALSLVSVEVDGPFHENTSACIRKSINRALTAARAALARLLASDRAIEMPEQVRAVLNGASVPKDGTEQRDFEAKHVGIVIRIDGKDCLVAWVDAPSPRHLFLLPRVVNAGLHAVESGTPQAVQQAFDSSWADIIGGLDDLESQLDGVIAEHGLGG
ncbi:hypothetical protein [Tessaracoccus sp. OH4464_COT-324]|uniref:hypothetical protein n=1 Tax=Tessaracoccus sp. OH4464_COT-324 TaxID=2491059 RepID=UPI000F63586C|nr:hypothetical protein [Tessaracoccus sp. OH4464_COT-324]RRD46814.1 hypothetical protein EII42_05105 [Tessaracoccus sp. OH4464_COT-324]